MKKILFIAILFIVCSKGLPTEPVVGASGLQRVVYTGTLDGLGTATVLASEVRLDAIPLTSCYHYDGTYWIGACIVKIEVDGQVELVGGANLPYRLVIVY